jgi:hypothetical protein
MPSRESKQLFLAVLQHGASIARAAAAVGMTRQQALDLREQDPVFAAAWDNAHETAVDALEDIAVSRAKATNDRLLELMLKAKRPEVYARPEAATTNQTVNVVMPTLAELDKRYEEAGLKPPFIEGDFAPVRRLSKPETHE